MNEVEQLKAENTRLKQENAILRADMFQLENRMNQQAKMKQLETENADLRKRINRELEQQSMIAEG